MTRLRCVQLPKHYGGVHLDVTCHQDGDGTLTLERVTDAEGYSNLLPLFEHVYVQDYGGKLKGFDTVLLELLEEARV